MPIVIEYLQKAIDAMQQIQTEVIPIDPLHPDPTLIQRAARLLQAGKLVVFPTETVYGLGADAFQASAVSAIFAAKGRPFSDPLIVHIADSTTLEQLVTHIPTQARQLAQTFWPGPLTLVLPANPNVPKLVTAGLSTVAVRMPSHPVALALIRATGSPIAAPSANRFMHVSSTTAQHAFADLNGRVSLILDAGPSAVGVESTVLDLCAEPPTILRPGGVSLEALRTLLPGVQRLRQRSNEHNAHQAAEIEAQKAPGQMLTHYAPSVPSFLVTGTPQQICATMLAEIKQRQARGERIGVLTTEEDAGTFQDSGVAIYILGSVHSPGQIAARLFAGLRTLEESGVQVILCRDVEEQGIGMAIHDRLLKATGGKVICIPAEQAEIPSE
jgi:L-threonylcarbamoyladenylate synthase